MTQFAKYIFAGAVAVLLLAACSSTPSAAQINGINGGLLFYAGSPILVYAMDVKTDSNSQVTGYGLIGDSSTEIYVDVTGYTGVGTANLTLRDLYGDSIILSTSQDGQVFRGTWRTSFSRDQGTTRFTHESNIANLSLQSLDVSEGGRLSDLF